MASDQFVTLPSGCKICYQVVGDVTHPAVLIINGHSCAMTQKTDGLIQLLLQSSNSLCVVRFDHRDTGLSTTFKKTADDCPVYTLEDMRDDIIGLIQHLNLTRVHLVGSSMGGTLAWQTALKLPDIVQSLALILTGPVGRQQLPTDNLPPLHLEAQWLLGEAFGFPEDQDDDQGWIESYSRLDLALATQPPTEGEKAESMSESEVTYRREKESGTMWTKFNHSEASGVRWPRELLPQVKCPTVVIHAEKDQLFPIQHAQALANEIPDAKLVILENCGHEFPPRVRPQIVNAILENLNRAI